MFSSEEDAKQEDKVLSIRCLLMVSLYLKWEGLCICQQKTYVLYLALCALTLVVKTPILSQYKVAPPFIIYHS